MASKSEKRNAEQQRKSLLIAKEDIWDQLREFQDFLHEITDSDLQALKFAVEVNEGLHEEFIRVHRELLGGNSDDEDVRVAKAERADFIRQHREAVGKARGLLPREVQTSTPVFENGNTVLNETIVGARIKLPTLSLPTFAGAYENWDEFVDSFNGIINSSGSLSNSQKLQYLKSALTGEALRVIQSIKVCDTNYDLAWSLLKERFSKLDLIVNSHVSAIVDLPVISKENAFQLRKLSDTVTKSIRCLEALNVPVGQWDAILIYLLNAKLDSTTKRKWETAKRRDVLPTLDQFRAFIRERCDILESLKAESRHTGPDNNRKQARVTNLTVTTKKCGLCHVGGHETAACSKWQPLSLQARKECMLNNRLCYKCLAGWEKRHSCKRDACSQCGGSHHVLLHDGRDGAPPASAAAVAADGQGGRSVVSTAIEPLKTSALLSTARVLIKDRSGRFRECRALLDNGAQSNFITEDLCKRLKLSKSNLNSVVCGINSRETRIKSQVDVTIRASFGNFERTLNCLVIDKITDKIPAESFERSILSVPSHVRLADPKFNISEGIDMLLGANMFWEILGERHLKGADGQRSLRQTKLGWIWAGCVVPAASTQSRSQVHLALQDSLERFWEVEECQEHSEQSQEEVACERSFIEQTTRHADGRFMVALPLKEEREALGESYAQAEKRFFNLERRLSRDAQFKALYVNFMEEYEQLGHMQRLERVDTDSIAYYIPHHGVLKAESTTTKLRAVYDASARTSSGRSLNDLLMVGPVVQDDLFSIVLRLRRHRFVVSADIEKMYRQVMVKPTDRPLQRILWRSSHLDALNIYELGTVTYGLASSSFLATRCLKELANEVRVEDPDVAFAIEHCIYVDDYIDGADSVEEINERVLKILNLNIDRCILWSDSTIVLAWIKTYPHMLKQFVGNRVSFIQSLKISCEWRHVPTADNPADLLSRGVKPRKLEGTSLWWQGPSWLLQGEDCWPKKDVARGSDNLPEFRKEKGVVLTVSNLKGKFDMSKFSKLASLLRILVYCLRWKNKRKGPISAEELEISLKRLVKIEQGDYFEREIKDVSDGKPVSKGSSIAKLKPILDEDRILRVGGRLERANLTYDARHQFILPSGGHLAKLIVEGEHLKLLHCGPQLLINSVRRRFWILRLRVLARSVVGKCIRCFREKPVGFTPVTGLLPAERVTPSFPFENCGLDFAGPFTIRDRKGRASKSVKCYVCLFICLATKALHLEVVSDLTTDAFLASLKRFIARRGKPSKILSDNATNFRGAYNELNELFTNLKKVEVQNVAAVEGINWQFIPPRAPNFGGLWESGVKSMKHHLKRVAGQASLTYEELSTLLCQIEAVLNSRPLTPMSSDPGDLNPLTPGHFLVGRALTAIPEQTLLDAPTNRLGRFEVIQKLVQHFWTRWVKEYLHILQCGNKSGVLREIPLGSLVVIKDDNLPPCRWKLGRVQQLHPGSDGIVRVVTLKTFSGSMKRAVRNVCVLPIEA